MSNIPPSADLNKLKSILGNAKALINADNKSVPTQNNRALPSPRQQEQMQYQQQQQRAPERDGYGPGQNIQYLSEADMLRSQQSQGQIPQQQVGMGDPTRRPGQITQEAYANSGMPDAVKKLMMDNPIAQATINHSFSLDDVSDLVDNRPAPQYNQQPQRMNENVMKNSNDSFTVSEAALRGIIKDVLVEYLTADYSKNLTEATIKKTINTLIKEGKIKTKPKK